MWLSACLENNELAIDKNIAIVACCEFQHVIKTDIFHQSKNLQDHHTVSNTLLDYLKIEDSLERIEHRCTWVSIWRRLNDLLTCLRIQIFWGSLWIRSLLHILKFLAVAKCLTVAKCVIRVQYVWGWVLRACVMNDIWKSARMSWRLLCTMNSPVLSWWSWGPRRFLSKVLPWILTHKCFRTLCRMNRTSTRASNSGANYLGACWLLNGDLRKSGLRNMSGTWNWSSLIFGAVSFLLFTVIWQYRTRRASFKRLLLNFIQFCRKQAIL